MKGGHQDVSSFSSWYPNYTGLLKSELASGSDGPGCDSGVPGVVLVVWFWRRGELKRSCSKGVGLLVKDLL